MALSFATTPMTLGFAQLGLAARDMNGDGAVDLVAASYSRSVRLSDMVAVALNETPAGSMDATFARLAPR